jgi:hypothetical protein
MPALAMAFLSDWRISLRFAADGCRAWPPLSTAPHACRPVPRAAAADFPGPSQGLDEDGELLPNPATPAGPDQGLKAAARGRGRGRV